MIATLAHPSPTTHHWQLIVGILGTLLLAGCAIVLMIALYLRPQSSAIMCPQLYIPVCGSDGVTYPNLCELQRKTAVTFTAVGTCQQARGMSTDERRFAQWLLVQRIAAGAPRLPIHHLASQVDQNRMVYYYGFGSDHLVARVSVQGAKVIEAVDANGYDYVTKTQGEALPFLTDIPSHIRRKGESCGREQQLCATGLICADHEGSDARTCEHTTTAL